MHHNRVADPSLHVDFTENMDRTTAFMSVLSNKQVKNNFRSAESTLPHQDQSAVDLGRSYLTQRHTGGDACGTARGASPQGDQLHAAPLPRAERSRVAACGNRCYPRRPGHWRRARAGSDHLQRQCTCHPSRYTADLESDSLRSRYTADLESDSLRFITSLSECPINTLLVGLTK